MTVTQPASGDARTSQPPAPSLPGRPWLWIAGFAALGFLFSRHALTPIVPGTSFSLISPSLALLAFALIIRPWREAPIYALIHFAAGAVLHPGIEFSIFTAMRVGLEVVEALLLAIMLRGYFIARLGDTRFVAFYTPAVLGLTAAGGLLLLAGAQAMTIAGLEIPPGVDQRPALAWRYWWLGHACSYLALAGPAAVLVALRHRLARILLDQPAERGTFLGMAGALLLVALLAFPIADFSWVGLPPDVRLALRLLPIPFALAMAVRFRANGASLALIILSPIIILSLTGPYAARNWAGLPQTATPTQTLLLIIAATCQIAGAISRQLMKATAEASEARQVKSRFVAMINHELRTPLNAILGFSELMQVQKVRDIDEAMGSIENIHASGQRLLAMIEGLLSQADRGASAFDLHKHPLRLAQFVASVVDELQAGLVAFRYPIAISIPDELTIEADEKALQQILLVLLSYPLRFVSPWTVIDVRARQSGTDTVLEVDSEGLSGAADDERDKLELQLAQALALAHGARLTITQAAKDRRIARLTFFATRAAA